MRVISIVVLSDPAVPPVSVNLNASDSLPLEADCMVSCDTLTESDSTGSLNVSSSFPASISIVKSSSIGMLLSRMNVVGGPLFLALTALPLISLIAMLEMLIKQLYLLEQT